MKSQQERDAARDWLGHAKRLARKVGESEMSAEHAEQMTVEHRQDALVHAVIAIAERLDRVVGALEPRDSVEVVSDLDQATQDKINRMFDTMREAAGRGAVPFTHVLADAFDLETERPGEEPRKRRRTIVQDESAKVNFVRGDALEDVVGLLTQEVDELNRIYGAQVAPALDRLQGGTGDPEEFAPAVVGHLADRAHGGCPECYVLNPFGDDHVAGCVVGTIIARLRDVRYLTARMHAGAVTGGSPEWRSGYDQGFAHGQTVTTAWPDARKLDAIAKLCADREVDDVNGGPSDAQEIWPSEIRAILRGEENPT